MDVRYNVIAVRMTAGVIGIRLPEADAQTDRGTYKHPHISETRILLNLLNVLKRGAAKMFNRPGFDGWPLVRAG